MPIGAAIGGAAVIGGATQVISGNKSAKAIKDSAATTDATNRYIFDTQRADNEPGRVVGNSALYKLADMYGVSRPVNPPVNDATMGIVSSGGNTPGYSGFETSPGYQFRVDEATKAIERSAAARGGLRSGATMDALQRRVQGVASSEYENYANRLSAMAGLAQTANNANAQAGQAYGAQQSATNMAAGNATASAYQNTGNAITGTVGNLASAYLYNKGYGGGFGGGTPVPGYGNA